MDNKKKPDSSFKLILLWSSIILVVPFGMIYLVAWFVEQFISNDSTKDFVLLFDLSQGMSISDYLGLYAAFAGIFVTFFLGIAIYQLNEKKEKSEKRKQQEINRLFLLKEMTTYLDKINEHVYKNAIERGNPISQISFNKSLFKVDENWKEKLFQISDMFTEVQYNTLYQFFVDIEALFRDKSQYDFIKDYTIPFYPDMIPPNEKKEIISLYEVFKYELYDVLNELKGIKVKGNRIIYYKTGEIFCEENEQEKKYVIYNLTGEVMHDYSLLSQSGIRSTFDNDGTLRARGKYIKQKMEDGMIIRGMCDNDGNYKKLQLNKEYEEISEEEFKKNEEDHIQYIQFADFEITEGKYSVIGNVKYGKRELY